MNAPRLAHQPRRGDRRTRSTAAVALDREVLLSGLVKRGLRAIESVATVACLILISDAVLQLFLHAGPKAPDLSPVTALERTIYWLAYAFILLQVVVRPRQMLRTAMRNPFVLAFVVTAALSFIWSDDPTTSLRRAFSLGMWTMFGYYLASRYDTTELLLHLGVALGLIALLSLATGVIAPDYGRESGFNGSAWRGVFTTKNVLGEIMLLAVVVFGSLARRAGWARIPAVLALMVSIALIALAEATAALLIVAIVAVTIPVVLMFRRNNAAAALMLCGLLGLSAVASVVVAEQDAVLSVLGKEATLTGRTVLWSQVVVHIEDRPVLGYGYGAFWEPKSAASERVRTAVGWDTPHSHNGLLDEWLDLGLVGVLSLLAAYVFALRRAWAALRSTVGIDGVWATSFLVMLFLGNATESSISSSLLIWTVFVAVASVRWPSPASRNRETAFAGAPLRAVRR